MRFMRHAVFYMAVANRTLRPRILSPYLASQRRKPDVDEDLGEEQPVGAAKWTAKHDATTKAAMGIIECERTEREAKTERLKAARLAKEATEAGA
ncbi:hypothetical protein GCM10008171_17380 [Methylopila jiangsuensis]|uniref:Uncharacterized protein n=2 Tax=Methylopila jiangsuensis TaxID=586230 RepID=A0A9W6JI51_9HYPH|nr:hypothetical protein GCM10008171_17380 [Methylopila jiangsuensis]